MAYIQTSDITLKCWPACHDPPSLFAKPMICNLDGMWDLPIILSDACGQAKELCPLRQKRNDHKSKNSSFIHHLTIEKLHYAWLSKYTADYELRGKKKNQKPNKKRVSICFALAVMTAEADDERWALGSCLFKCWYGWPLNDGLKPVTLVCASVAICTGCVNMRVFYVHIHIR